MSTRESKSAKQSLLTTQAISLHISRYYLLVSLSVLLVLLLTMFIPHDQRRLHMPEPWSYGHLWHRLYLGKHTDTNPWKTGLILASVCLSLVLIAIFIGATNPSTYPWRIQNSS